MFDIDSMAKQAVSAFAPSDAVFARVKNRIREKQQKGATGGAVLVCVNKNSEKIFRSVFKKHDKLMQKIA